MRANPERDAAIVEAINSGATYESIGQRFGISRARVQQIAKRLGLPPRRKPEAA